MTAHAHGFAIKVKRVYEPPDEADGYRVLVDRIWPRGISKAAAKLDEWLKDIAPSTELRTWFGHDPARWHDFKAAYFEELAQADLTHLTACPRKTLTLVFAAKDEAHNNAVALKEYLARFHASNDVEAVAPQHLDLTK